MKKLTIDAALQEEIEKLKDHVPKMKRIVIKK